MKENCSCNNFLSKAFFGKFDRSVSEYKPSVSFMNIPPQVGLCPHNDEGSLTGTSGGKQFGSQENSKVLALFLTSG